MPPITIDSHSLMIAGRRTAIAGAGVEYAAMDPSIRPAVLRSFAALGFNTVMASCLAPA
jgi:beta-galactosidase GanA